MKLKKQEHLQCEGNLMVRRHTKQQTVRFLFFFSEVDIQDIKINIKRQC